jgi:hypothetical protein
MVVFADSYSQAVRVYPRFAQMFHNGNGLGKTLKGNQIIVLTARSDGRILQEEYFSGARARRSAKKST